MALTGCYSFLKWVVFFVNLVFWVFILYFLFYPTCFFLLYFQVQYFNIWCMVALLSGMLFPPKPEMSS